MHELSVKYTPFQMIKTQATAVEQHSSCFFQRTGVACAVYSKHAERKTHTHTHTHTNTKGANGNGETIIAH